MVTYIRIVVWLDAIGTVDFLLLTLCRVRSHEIPWSWGPDIYLDVDLVVGGCHLDIVNLLVLQVASR